MHNYLISQKELEKFKGFLEKRGIKLEKFYSKGTTSLIFLGKWRNKEVIIKLERLDTPRKNLQREANILRVLKGHEISPLLIDYGMFNNREFLVREFAIGEPLLYTTPEKDHLLQILEETYKLDLLGIDHGQIQGGKHIIIGDHVWIIDFEKASLRRKPKNVTTAMAMIFLNNNVISKRVREKFKINPMFLETLRKELKQYKETKNIEKIKELLCGL